MTGPVGFILNTRRDVKKGQVALERVKEFYAKLSEEDISGAKSVVNDWTQYSVENMEYKYKESNGAFALRNINISFSRGQVSFIIGGNGSGKSTLSKCLSLHYRPTGGRIAFDKQNVERDNLTSARNKISAIYSDYYLFKKLYGISTDICVDKINKYLDYLQLSDKVVITNGCFSTTALSDGQRKRLALLVLLLENRDICIFDEWAADQDPEFKEIFYRKILRELKLENKVIIVISHDDRFFEHADRLITMENGTVKHDSGSINKIESKNNHGMFEFSEKQLGCLHAAMSD